MYTGLGIIITTILQSSSATLALILTALAAGQIEYENALALAIGANVGTTITAVLGSLGSNSAGRRLALAHLIFNFTTGLTAIILIFPLAQLVNNIAELVALEDDNYTIKLAIFHTIFNVLGVLLMLPFIKKLERFLLRFFKEKSEPLDVSQPKYLNKAVLKFPGSAITSLLLESKYLYKKSVFKIVAQALNIHVSDVKSDEKLSAIISRSSDDFEVDVEGLYYSKVKTIYGEIIKYASLVQSELDLSPSQIKAITEIKIANRKMVEIIKDARELNKNITVVLNTENKHLQNEYDVYRKKLTKVLRVIYLFRTDNENNESKYALKLKELKAEAKANARQSSKSIDRLIRKDLVTAEQASSLFNDYTNVNDMIKKLINVAELLYGKIDSILDENVSDEKNA